MAGGHLRIAALALLLFGAFFVSAFASAQDIDSNITSRTRQPAAIADQIANLKERAAFLGLYEKLDSESLFRRASTFLQEYPDSAFLASDDPLPSGSASVRRGAGIPRPSAAEVPCTTFCDGIWE